MLSTGQSPAEAEVEILSATPVWWHALTDVRKEGRGPGAPGLPRHRPVVASCRKVLVSERGRVAVTDRGPGYSVRSRRNPRRLIRLQVDCVAGGVRSRTVSPLSGLWGRLAIVSGGWHPRLLSAAPFGARALSRHVSHHCRSIPRTRSGGFGAETPRLTDMRVG